MEDHETSFPARGSHEDAIGAAMWVAETGNGAEEGSLPLSHDGEVGELGPIVERCVVLFPYRFEVPRTEDTP